MISDNMVVALIGAGSGILGAAIGAGFSYLSSRAQYRAMVVASSRQAWIATLRDTIAEFQATTVKIGLTLDGSGYDRAESLKTYERGALLRARIALLVNPEEAQHQTLVRLLDENLIALSRSLETKNYSGLGDAHRKITEAAQPLLKAEWVRVKRGE